LLEQTRVYALEKLDESGERELACRRHECYQRSAAALAALGDAARGRDDEPYRIPSDRIRGSGRTGASQRQAGHAAVAERVDIAGAGAGLQLRRAAGRKT
jgi:predicted ATPase